MPLHWYDLAILLAVALLFFGPKRLPEMGSAVGKTIKEFRKSMNEVTEPAKPEPPRELPAPSNPAPSNPAPTASATTATAAPAATTAAPEAPKE